MLAESDGWQIILIVVEHDRSIVRADRTRLASPRGRGSWRADSRKRGAREILLAGGRGSSSETAQTSRATVTSLSSERVVQIAVLARLRHAHPSCHDGGVVCVGRFG